MLPSNPAISCDFPPNPATGEKFKIRHYLDLVLLSPNPTSRATSLERGSVLNIL